MTAFSTFIFFSDDVTQMPSEDLSSANHLPIILLLSYMYFTSKR